jgi:hypothetical protein
VVSAAFSLDGTRVVTASYDKTARVWDAGTGKPLTGPLKHQDRVQTAVFSPDGNRIVTASEDQTARVWDFPVDQGTLEQWSVIAARSPFVLNGAAYMRRALPRHFTPAPQTSESALAAPVLDAATPLPDGFPAVGAPALTGTLADRPFVAKKAALRVLVGGARLEINSWTTGVPCEPQLAPHPDQLYIEVMFGEARAVAGAIIRPDDPGVVAIYQTPTHTPVKGSAATVVFDKIGADHATGRVLLIAPDGTHVAGSFDAVVCASPQRAADATSPRELHGLRWGARVEPTAIPAEPVAAILIGRPAAPVAIEAIDWQAGDYAQHEFHFFMTRPAEPCALDQLSPGFNIGLHGLAAGDTANMRLSTVTRIGGPHGVVIWDEPGNVVGLEGSGYLSARIDAVTPNEIRGRLFAWFNDPSKSMIAGAFTATNCHVKP